MQFNNDGNSVAWLRVLGKLNHVKVRGMAISEAEHLFVEAAEAIEELLLERNNLSQMASYWKGMAKGIESVKMAQTEDMEMSR